MSGLTYVLNSEGEPVREPDMNKWATWAESAMGKLWPPGSVVARYENGSVVVSTIFLGLDHSYSHACRPVLWETMVFGGPNDQEQTRCSGTREQALAMHASMLKLIRRK